MAIFVMRLKKAATSSSTIPAPRQVATNEVAGAAALTVVTVPAVLPVSLRTTVDEL
jgi:hypothetical protein